MLGGDDAAADDETPEDGGGVANAQEIGDEATVRAQLADGLDGLDSILPAGGVGGGGAGGGGAGGGGAVGGVAVGGGAGGDDGGEGGGGDDGGGDGAEGAEGGRRAPKLSAWIDSPSYGKFIGITTFFNPGRHQNKVDNFRKFRESVAAQGLQLLCVELVFGLDTPFQLRGENENAPPADADADADADAAADGAAAPPPPPADCDILIGKRTTSDNTLWQKERLLNIALDNLPNSVDKVMWLDSDLIFLNDDWVPETAELLDRYPVVRDAAIEGRKITR